MVLAQMPAACSRAVPQGPGSAGSSEAYRLDKLWMNPVTAASVRGEESTKRSNLSSINDGQVEQSGTQALEEGSSVCPTAISVVVHPGLCFQFRKSMLTWAMLVELNTETTDTFYKAHAGLSAACLLPG